ncbi:MAG: RimK family protein [Candidatus Hydrogenedentes bacterium]|nr:RimK family protein [Candidatus Hydrogenedentota bacterium]
MKTYIVVEDPKCWKFTVPGVELVKARDYLSDDRFSKGEMVKVLNCCYHYYYQSTGYYVSLVAAARGHYPMPSVQALQDMRHNVVIRNASRDLTMQIQRSFKNIHGDHFELSIYFGRNVAHRYNTLSKMLFNLFPLPFFRAYFVREKEEWILESVRIIAVRDIPDHHYPFVMEQISQYVGRHVWKQRGKQQLYHYEMAILRSNEDTTPPSNAQAIQRFCRSADRKGIGVEIIDRHDYAQLDRYDALFIRDTTAVNHYTYRFARRAESVGIPVIDDSLSILRCANKIYLTELMRHHGISTPKSLIIGKHTAYKVKESIGFPCVLKIPDSSFSLGVYKLDSYHEFEEAVDNYFKNSELLLAQEYIPTDFDWRVGVLNHQPLFVCRYYMAEKHWQIYNHHSPQGTDCGMADTVAVEDAPPKIIAAALRATQAIGNGLYGVDIKEIKGKPWVIEVNDNPNIDAGIEDRVLKDELYDRIICEFIRRLDLSHGKS